jgi:D-beta-D-heptose 7-phosphate kinase / D-beta-D-heptose 1-phosphate adenosyltransferase
MGTEVKLTSLISQWQGKNALVIGDPMVDCYVHGEARRLSPEAPVPVFVETSREERRGGADNVAHNLEVLGLKTFRIFPPLPWTTKTRYLAGNHQLMRVDADVHRAINTAWYVIHATALLSQVVVISDYNKGALSEDLCLRLIRACKAHDIPVVVDPKGNDWLKYAGASVVCPNEHELQTTALGIVTTELQKLGSRGMLLKVPEEEPIHIPARARQVFDVTGAGDTVVATVAAALAVGAGILEAAKLASIAAGIVVGKVGTSTCPVGELWMGAAGMNREERLRAPEGWPKFVVER